MDIKIGLAISVHNRNEFAKHSIDEWKRTSPNIKIVVVDDASDIPFEGADFRFNTNVGIAAVKNKSLELLNDCDHIFLADDDIYAKKIGWHLPYINSGKKHLCLTFDKFSNGKPNGRVIEKTEKGISYYKEPCGLLLYLTNDVLKKVGGMDTSYGRWGYEHLNFSIRIFNNGFTEHPFMDIENGIDLFYSHDHQQTITRSVDAKTRLLLARKNIVKYKAEIKSAKFIPYLPQKNLILTCYFTSLIDPQRGVKWEYDKTALNALRLSVPEGVEFAVISDNEYQSTVTIPKHDNPYLAKWIAFRDYLTTHDVDNVFCVDGTDVEVLVNPFPHVKEGFIYVGDELAITNNQWLKNHHNVPLLNELLKMGRLPLLNAGIIGGRKDIVLEFLNAMCDGIEQNVGMTDMLKFNYTLWSKFKSRIVHGRKVNTVFKSFDKFNREGAWFRHK